LRLNASVYRCRML